MEKETNTQELEQKKEYGFEHRFTLHGMQNWVPGSKPISIGEAGSPGNNQRSRIENGPHAGWFLVYPVDTRRCSNVHLTL